MHFSLRQIAVFDAVVRLGSVSRAAADVALSQSAASMALKELENTLGAQLFHRHGRKLILNENGRRLQPKAHSLLLLAADIKKAETEELEGLLRVGASTTIGNYVLPECSAAFLNRHPKVRLVMSTATIPETVDRVEAMSVDLGVLETHCNRNTVLSERVGHDRAIVFAAPTHPFAGRTKISMANLRTASWCLREGPSLTRSHLTTTLGVAGLDIRFEANTNEAIKAAVAAGLGLGFASTRVIAREVAAGELVAIEAHSVIFEREFTLLTPKRVYQGALPRAFAEHLRGWFLAETSAGRAA